jgi:hypothetical protein
MTMKIPEKLKSPATRGRKRAHVQAKSIPPPASGRIVASAAQISREPPWGRVGIHAAEFIGLPRMKLKPADETAFQRPLAP